MATINEALQIALQHHQSGELQQAEQLYRRILDAEPRQADALHLLGVLAHQAGKNQSALQSINQAIALQPNSPQMHNNVAGVHADLGQQEQAVASYRKAIALEPGYLDAHYNLGNVLRDLGQFAEAVTSYQHALAIDPYHALVHNNLGTLRQIQGQLSEAIASFRTAVKVKPDFIEAIANLGAGLRDQGRLAEAADVCRRAIEKDPGFADAHGNLALALRDQGKLDEAIAALREALRLDPNNAERHSQMLFCLNHHPAATSDMLLTEHRHWAERHTAASDGPTRIQVDREADRPLRIGYVSPNLCRHVVANFFEPILEHHDPQQVETYCYADLDHADEVTARLQQHASHWRDASAWNDQQLFDAIRRDRIDILVDLAGHTIGNRLGMFAKNPAAIQASYLGYPNTTGLDAIDYRITDVAADPPGESQAHTEKLYALPDGFLCFRPPDDAPPVESPPVKDHGFITFGSFNRLMKINNDVVSLWAEILNAVPESRLLLKEKALDDAAVRAHWQQQFARFGIAENRLMLLGHVETSVGHLAAYGQVDIALDPFPYNGTGTTCEALWMGVPVVTLVGDRHAGRVGASLLHQIGMSELVAESRSSYLQIAKDLAGDLPRLERLRAGQRRRIASSSLCGGERLTQSLERAYRSMWCESHR